MTKERADQLLPLLRLQPGIIHNNRLGGGYRGDTETPEQFIPATGYPGRDWETYIDRIWFLDASRFKGDRLLHENIIRILLATLR